MRVHNGRVGYHSEPRLLVSTPRSLLIIAARPAILLIGRHHSAPQTFCRQSTEAAAVPLACLDNQTERLLHFTAA